MDKSFVLKGLDKMIDDPKCELNFGSNFQLLVAVILSAQCTDKRVNMVTDELFKTHKTPEDFANIPLEELEQKIHSCGFYRNKAKSIKAASRDIIERFGGEVPSDFDDLISLAGVGRKTANVVLSVAFGKEALAVDTHVLRVSNRLGLVKTDNPDKCEERLVQFFPKESWSKVHYQMVLFGRYICKAIKPDCANCQFAPVCPYKKEKECF
ncbi:MAG: endonuclease III [Clostridiales bacterium]|nr:endonuclease III [Clostridiales bacterium]